MNGVHPPDGNRFLELVSNGKNKQRNKRPRPDDFVPLPTITSNERNTPRYLVATAISSNENGTPPSLASYNVFQVERGLNFISPDRLEVNEMRSGDLLIKVADKKTADKFLKANYIDSIPVKITLHKTLNTIQGRIFSRKIIEIPQEELLLALKEQKVVDIHKIMRKDGDKMVATGAAIITFDLLHRPEKIKLGWELVSVDEFIPNPMRCLNCQRLGHTRKRCRNVEQCKDCGFTPPHEQCSRKYCVNCQNENHPSYDPDCPTFWKHKSVNYIRITRKCTTREAWAIYNDNPVSNTLKPTQRNNKTSYANILKSTVSENNIINNKNVHAKTNGITDHNKATINETTLNNNNTNGITEHNKATIIETTLNNNNTTNNTNNNITTILQVPTTSLSSIISKNQNIHNETTNTQQNITSILSTLNSSTESLNKTTQQNAAAQINTEKELSDDDDTGFWRNCPDETDMVIDKNIDQQTILDDINEGLGFTTPTKNGKDEDFNKSPCSQLYENFPELNTIITPKTFKHTLPKHGKKK